MAFLANGAKLFAALAALVATGCVFHGHTWSFTQLSSSERTQVLELSATDARLLEVSTGNGAVSIIGSDDAQDIQVTATIRAYGSTVSQAEQNLDRITIEPELAEGVWTIEADLCGLRKGSVRYEILLPRHLAIKLHSGNGRLEVRNIQAPVTAHSGNGLIKVLEHDGPLKLDSGNGQIVFDSMTTSIDVETSNGAVEGHLLAVGPVSGRVTTGNGAVQLHLGDLTSCKLEARTGNGAVRLKHATSNSSISSRRISATIGDYEESNGILEIRSGNGSIHIH